MYRLYLIDFDGASIELDTEDLDFGLELRISNLQDLSLRTGSRTKEITIKGTARNNNAFGYIYRLNRVSNLDLDNKLFFNYNSLRQVDCIVYKETNLIFRGTLRLIETVRIKGLIYYKAVITDSVIDFMKVIQEKLLTDLNILDLRHIYNLDNIIRSWDNTTQRKIGNTYSYSPFQLGSGYVYPYAYYGLTPSPTLTQDNIYNYRPAMYVREIMNRIFSQTGLTGYSYEIKTTTNLNEKFDRLIIPNNQERLSARTSNFKQTISRLGTMSSYNNLAGTSPGVGGMVPTFVYLFDMRQMSLTGSVTDVALLTTSDPNKAVWSIASQTDCDALMTVNWTWNNFYGNSELYFDVVERIAENNYSTTSGWQSVGAFWTGIFATSGTYSGTSQVYINKRTWEKNKQLGFRMMVNGYSYTNAPNATASFTIPWSDTGNLNIDVLYNNEIAPTLPENVKQYDFVKGLMLIYNMYAYTEKARPKHIIFQTYDEFYAFANPLYLKELALDWSNKIIYDADWKKTFNLTIPKSYLYSFKEDKDYINTDYKNQFNAIYGQFRFSDAFGLTDERKVEPIFSPSPMTEYNEKRFPTIRGGDEKEVKTTGSNIRIQYYNGIKDTANYTLIYGTTSLSTVNQYGQQSEYYIPGTQSAVEVLQYGVPRKVYFPRGVDLITTPNLYFTYHIGQITELTSEDLYTMECRAFLSSVDIGNFDFRTPIYITTDIGNSYYKVLEIDWKDDYAPATIRLQSIGFETAPQVATTTSTTTTTTTAAPNFVQNTIINITKPGYLKYDDSAGVTKFVYIINFGNYTLTDCHNCSTIRAGFPFAELATWSSITCGSSC